MLNNLGIPFSNSHYMKNSIAYQGAIIWNLLSLLANGTGIKAFTKKAWQSSDLRELNFSAESPTTIQHKDTDFVYLGTGHKVPGGVGWKNSFLRRLVLCDPPSYFCRIMHGPPIFFR